VSDDALHPAEPAGAPSTSGRLDSWKEIAAYLKRDVTTVRRWEKREGLPVRRHLHQQRDSVYAFTAEIDQWRLGRAEDHPNHAPDPETTTAVPSPVWKRPGVAWTVAAMLALTTLSSTVLLVVRVRPDAGRDGEVRFAVFPPEHTSFGSVSLSPDGRQLAFTATTADGRSQLYVRPLDTLAARPLPGTDGATFPFWSPRGEAVAFFAGGKLRCVDLAAGNVRVIGDAPNGRGGSWHANGTIVFAPDRDGGLFHVAAAGGPPVPLTTVNRPRERGHLWPEFLPEGDRFLYLADSSQSEHHNLFIGALDGRPPARLFPLASNAVYGNGFLFFARDRQLVAQPFDPDRAAPTGEPVILAEDVLQQWQLDHKTDVSVSRSGAVVFRTLRGPDTQLVWRDRSEGQLALTRSPAQHFEPTLSPDGRRVAVDVFDPRPSKRFGFGLAGVTSDIWILDAASGAASRLTFDPGAEFDPVWSPDGGWVAFSSNRAGTLDLYQRRLDDGDGDELLFSSAAAKHLQAWSPDGRSLVYASLDPGTRMDLWLLPLTGARTPTPLLRTAASEEHAQIAPDGRWFAYSSDETGRSEVYVQAFPEPARKWQVSTNGGGHPRWRADGGELFYLAEDRRLMAVPVKTGAAFDHQAAVPLFDTGLAPRWGTARNHYDVSRDGQRFLVMAPLADDRASPFTIVLNWAPPRP